jgi:predicted signal transduction protein with EAL and GGDEF domain
VVAGLLRDNGVEDRETLDQLGLLGCGISQGYLFGKPLPPADLAACIAELGVVGERPPNEKPALSLRP